MTAISILNDKVTTIPILFENAAGTGVVAPSGDSYSVTSSAPSSLGAAVGGTAANPTVILTPLVQAGAGYVVTFSDAKGLPPLALTININPDPSLATQMVSGLLTQVSQPIPSAPGP